MEQQVVAPAARPSISVQRQYLADLSFESSGFRAFAAHDRDESQFKLRVSVGYAPKGAESYEVVVMLRGEALRQGLLGLTVEVSYAGLFTLRGFPAEAIDPTLRIEAGELLFPFVRKIVNGLLVVNGMNEFLQPIDFSDIYLGHLRETGVRPQPASPLSA